MRRLVLIIFLFMQWPAIYAADSLESSDAMPYWKKNSYMIEDEQVLNALTELSSYSWIEKETWINWIESLKDYNVFHPLPLDQISKFFNKYRYLIAKIPAKDLVSISDEGLHLFFPKLYRHKYEEMAHLMEIERELDLVEEGYKVSQSPAKGFFNNILKGIKQMTQARADFIEKNFSPVDLIYSLGFYFDSEKGYIRQPLSDAAKPWADLQASYRYIQIPDEWLGSLQQLSEAGENHEVIAGIKKQVLSENEQLLPYPFHQDKPLKDVKELLKLIDGYHEVKKTTYSTIDKRLQYLNAIERHVKNISDIYKDNAALEAILLTASNKAAYLRRLQADMKKREKETFGIPEVDPEIAFVLGTKPPIRFMHKFWSRQVKDPCHRGHSLPIIYLEDLNTWGLEIDFERKKYPDEYKIDKSVQFIDGIGRTSVLNVNTLRKELLSEDNEISQVHLNNNAPDDQVADGVYIFVVDQNGKLYILPGDRGSIELTNNDKLVQKAFIKQAGIGKWAKHDDLLEGGNVLLAGELRFKDGKIVEINNRSGHYTPTFSNISYGLRALLFKNPGAFDVRDLIVTDNEGRRIKDLVGYAKNELKQTMQKIFQDIEEAEKKRLEEQPKTLSELPDYHNQTGKWSPEARKPKNLKTTEDLNRFIQNETDPNKILKRRLDHYDKLDKETDDYSKKEEIRKQKVRPKLQAGFDKIRRDGGKGELVRQFNYLKDTYELKKLEDEKEKNDK